LGQGGAGGPAHRSPGSLPRMVHHHHQSQQEVNLPTSPSSRIGHGHSRHHGRSSPHRSSPVLLAGGGSPVGLARQPGKLEVLDGPNEADGFDWKSATSIATSQGSGGVDLASSLPIGVLEHLFSFLDLTSLKSAAQVCKRWSRFLCDDENSDVWRVQCLRLLSQEALQSTELLATLPTYKAKVRAYCHSWNPDDCSRNIYVKPSGFTLHRNPVARSTDGGRGRLGFRHGRHAWEVIWEGPLGTVAVIGIATKDAPNQCHGYVALLGSNDQSWGWNLVDNHLLHNGDSQGNYPQLNNAPKYQVGERIRVILDCDENTLAFERNYEFLGVAFRGLPEKRLFPSISAVYGNTEVSMVYIGPPLDA